MGTLITLLLGVVLLLFWLDLQIFNEFLDRRNRDFILRWSELNKSLGDAFRKMSELNERLKR